MADRTLAIPADLALVRPAVVAVKVVTLDGKQVTLAVWRQIPEKVFRADDLPRCSWGWVNECPRGCNFGDSHRHLLAVHPETGALVRTVAEEPGDHPNAKPGARRTKAVHDALQHLHGHDTSSWYVFEDAEDVQELAHELFHEMERKWVHAQTLDQLYIAV